MYLVEVKSSNILFLSVFFIFLITSNLEAKNLYVSKSGSDSTSYSSNDISHPWLTPYKAWEQAHAGDTVYFRSGTYTVTSQISTRGMGYDGTESSPITFMPYPGETVNLNANINRAFMIHKDWNIIKGFNCTFPGTMFYFGYDNTVHGGEVSDINASMTTGGDNTALVYINSGSSDISIKNCVIDGPGSGAHLNTTAIIIFLAQNISVLNNEISGFPIGVYYKHGTSSSTGFEMAYNYITNTTRYSVETNSHAGNIHDNIFGANNARFRINEENGHADGDYNTINHNTFLSGQIYLSSDGDGANNNTITNNIISSYSACCSGNSWDYNAYVSGSAIGSHDIGTASITYTGGTSPSTIAGFALTSGSDGYGAGSDGEDMGADVSLVGSSIVTMPKGESTIQPPPLLRLSGECSNYRVLHPDWIFCDDFESDELIRTGGRYFDYDDDDGEFVRVAGTGFNTSYGMMSTFQSGEVDAGMFALGFGRNPVPAMNNGVHETTDYREIYYRMYVRMDAGWEGNPYKLSRASVVADSSWSQAMIAHLWESSASEETLAIDPASCVTDNSVNCSGWNDTSNLQWLGKNDGITRVYSTANANQWHCVEVHVKLNDSGQANGVHEFWIDGNLEARSENLNFTGTYTDYALNYISFENYWNGGSPATQSRYFDNIVVSTTPIGCQ